MDCNYIGREQYRYFPGARCPWFELVGHFQDHAGGQTALVGKTSEVEDYVLKQNILAIDVARKRPPGLVKKLSKISDNRSATISRRHRIR